jgi:predicted aminopeptidase
MRARVPLGLFVLAVAAALFGQGCATLDYLAQAGAGQDEILTRGRDIDALLADGRLGGKTRRLVAEISDVKRWGERHGLRPTRNFQKYVRLDRPAAVWMVSACEPLRFRSKVWSFPLVGSFTYLGYFDLAKAKARGDDLRREGWDADVRPAGAYSTGGWLDDPLYSSMIGQGDDARGDLVNTVFHESMHATFFAPGQSRLNESVANFVGDKLGEKYMREIAGPDAKETTAYLAYEERRRTREERLHAAYAELEALYASRRPREEKLAEKARIFAALEKSIGAKRKLSNASLVQFKTYHSGEAELEALLAACGGDVTRFIGRLARWQGGRSDVEQEEPAKLLEPLVREGCP